MLNRAQKKPYILIKTCSKTFLKLRCNVSVHNLNQMVNFAGFRKKNHKKCSQPIHIKSAKLTKVPIQPVQHYLHLILISGMSYMVGEKC